MHDPIVVLTSESNNFERLKTELLRQPHIKQVSASDLQLWGVGGLITSVSTSGNPQASRRMVGEERVHYGFLRHGRVSFSCGARLDRAQGSDVGQAAIIDRTLAEQHGWSPQSAIGKTLFEWVPGQEHLPATLHTVIGVVENKATRLLGLGATSSVFFLEPDVAMTPIVRIATAKYCGRTRRDRRGVEGTGPADRNQTALRR